VSLAQFLILQRVFAIASLISERLEHLIPGDLPSIDIDEIVVWGRFDLEVSLINDWSILISERYQIEDYMLAIRYNYLLRKASGSVVCSYDNAPHHIDVRTFPHHKHRYPKDKFRPTEFSGRFGDFLEEVVYEIQR